MLEKLGRTATKAINSDCTNNAHKMNDVGHPDDDDDYEERMEAARP